MFKRKPIITAITLAMSNLAHADLTTGLSCLLTILNSIC